MYKIDLDQAIAYNKYNLHLSNKSTKYSVEKIASNLIGLHASRENSPLFSILARTNSTNIETVISNLLDTTKIIKIRCMRGTLHYINLTEASIFHMATLNKRINTCKYLINRLGAQPGNINLFRDMIINILSEKSRNITDLKSELINRLNKISPHLERRIFLELRLLWEEGFLLREDIYSDWNNRYYKFRLLNQAEKAFIFEQIDEENAEKKLIYKYFKAYGPATLEDASWWSNISKTRIHKIITSNNDIVEINFENSSKIYYATSHIFNKTYTLPQNELNVHLLSFEDNLLKGYKESRYRFFNKVYYTTIFNNSGEANASILVNNKIQGIWKYIKSSHTIVAYKFPTFPRKAEHLLQKRNNPFL